MIKNKCKKIVSAMLLMTMIATTFSVDVFAGGEFSCCTNNINCDCKEVIQYCHENCCPCISPTPQPDPTPKPEENKVVTDTIFPPAHQPEPVYTYNNNQNYQYNNQANISNIIISTIPSGVTSIADGEFKNRKDLTSITIPDSVTEIGKEAFKGCTSLKNVEIGENVTSIGKEAFRGCISLESITIPKSVKSVGEKAFADCKSLNSVSHFGTCDLFSDESIFANHCNGGFNIKEIAEQK